jgi:hypothetical protein
MQKKIITTSYPEIIAAMLPSRVTMRQAHTGNGYVIEADGLTYSQWQSVCAMIACSAKQQVDKVL